ncbi:hypothetical protein [Vibrio paucivorans]
MMKKHSLVALVALFTSCGVYAQSHTAFNSETMCKRQYADAVFLLQVEYSNHENSDQVRRTAERTIDRSRDIYASSDSFCSALNYLVNDAPETLVEDFERPRRGEALL